MDNLLKRGDRVKHASRTDWGLGEVLDDQSEYKVRVIFEDVGLKTFDLKVAAFKKVSGEEAQSAYLSALVKQATQSAHKGRKTNSSPLITFGRAVELFQEQFPGGFQDPKYLSGPSSEREYKVAASRLLLDTLGHDEFQKLLQARHYGEIWDRAKSVINETNLIHHYEKMWLADALSTEGRRQLFATELWACLYGDETPQRRFERFAKMLYDIGAAKWTIATYFPFLAFPEKQIFLKPEVTKHAAKILGEEICYQPEVNWPTYSRVLRFAETLKRKLSEARRKELSPLAGCGKTRFGEDSALFE